MRQRQSFAIILIGKSILLREKLSRILRSASFRILASVSGADDLVPSKLQLHQPPSIRQRRINFSRVVSCGASVLSVPTRIARSFSSRGAVMLLGWDKSRREVPVSSKQINLQSESVMADVCLGITVAGLYTLVGMGLVIVFM